MFRRNPIPVWVGILVLSGIFLIGQDCAAQIVNFPDPNLEQAIRDAIGKPTGDIYAADLVGLTDLDASSASISDLTGLEYCTDLTSLNLYGNDIVDVSPLSGLTSLLYLHLGGNQIVNLSPLSGLTSLLRLTLSSNPIVDLSPLSGLTNLDVLWLWSNPIVDVSPLSGLTEQPSAISRGVQGGSI